MNLKLIYNKFHKSIASLISDEFSYMMYLSWQDSIIESSSYEEKLKNLFMNFTKFGMKKEIEIDAFVARISCNQDKTLIFIHNC